MTELQTNITKDLKSIEEQMGNPTFTWQNNTYPIVASVASFDRQLESGGFAVDLLLTGTVRINNLNGSKQVTTIPQPQQKLVYNVDGRTYRINTVHQDPTQSYFRIIARGTFKGI